MLLSQAIDKPQTFHHPNNPTHFAKIGFAERMNAEWDLVNWDEFFIVVFGFAFGVQLGR